MCGLVGAFSPDGIGVPVGQNMIDQMLAPIRHRGPDGEGTWIDDHVGIGHRRLAIIDLSAAGAQPMTSDSGRYVLAFNGEIYNAEALRGGLAKTDYRGHSDTEVLLAMIEQHGLGKTLRAAVGMFAIALWDRRDKRLSLARDRLGEKPLYYGWAGRRLIFGSELKGLRVAPDFDGTPSSAAIAEVLAFGHLSSQRSIYAAMCQVGPGEILAWQVGRVAPGEEPCSREHFWEAAQAVRHGAEHPFKGTVEDAADALQDVLTDAISLQSHADVPVGVFLSGGVDSSLVTALLARAAPGRVRSYSIGFDREAFDEAAAAKAVARAIGTDHTEWYVSEEEARRIVPTLADIFDEPLADSSQIPMLILARLARTDVTVALSGDGADELMGGYSKYLRGDRLWSHPLRPVLGPLLAGVNYAVSPAIRRLESAGVAPRLPWHSVSAATDLYANRDRAAFVDSVSMLNRSPASFMPLDAARVVGTAEDGDHAMLSYRRHAMLADSQSYLPGDILTKVDRTTMAASLESRAPFLDHRVVELAASFPDQLLFDDKGGKLPARTLLYRLVPRALVDRPKAGFCVPLGDWLRGDLRQWAYDVLLSSTSTQVLAVDRATALLDRHIRGPHDLSARLWPMLTLASWASRAFAPVAADAA